MVLYFYLRGGKLPGCQLRLQRGVTPNAYRLALLYAHEASKQATEAGVAVISAQLWGQEELLLWGQGKLSVCLLLIRTICLSPVDKLISDDDLFLFLIHSSDLQEVFCLAMLIIASSLLPSSQHQQRGNEEVMEGQGLSSRTSDFQVIQQEKHR